MKQKRVTFNDKIKVKEFRKNEPICEKKNLEYKKFIIVNCTLRILIMLLVIFSYKLSFHDKLWANMTIIISSLIIYFITNYNYEILEWLHLIWVPGLTFLSAFLTNKMLTLESLWFCCGVQFAWAVFGSCIFFEQNNSEFSSDSSNLASMLAIIWTVILTYKVSK